METEQIGLFEEKDIASACALTGHRALSSDFSDEKLEEILKDLIDRRGVNTFYCGMAVGFDSAACEMLLSLRDEGRHVRIVACVPCPEQAARFSPAQKARYERLLASCDEKVIVSPRYDGQCMQKRNRYMVDRAAYLVAYCNKDKGGAANTVRYAQKKGRTVIFPFVAPERGES